MKDIIWVSLQKIYEHLIPEKTFWRLSYDWIAGEQPEAFALMNYGFVEDPNAEYELTDDESLCHALYRHVAGAVTLEGKLLLEVGSGRGGGLAHIKQVLRPRLAVGIDLSSRAVALARRRHTDIPGLSFLQGDAEALPFGKETFDAVLNVESSHCYPSKLHFYQEVRRVLVNGGYFLYTDFFDVKDLKDIKEMFQEALLFIEIESNITDNVLASLRFDEARKLRLIDRMSPRMRETFRNFAATTDSETYRLFATGVRKYMRFVLRR
ncbi:MAG TPA: class I SAM-dependent methyltransferase [Kamptonema sp.]|nr:class I SAM-dependent methyltransferase [Kamptonema sp.]